MSINGEKLRLTKHASNRWQERFPGVDLDNAFAATRRPSKKLKKRIIQQQCPGSADHMYAANRYYLVNMRERIVFVLASDTQELITVFPLTTPGAGQLFG